MWKFKITPILIITSFILEACTFSSGPVFTSTPAYTNTPVSTSTRTPKPTQTPYPTKTPNLAATQQFDDWTTEIQQYYDKGYIDTTDGKLKKLDNFSNSWAQIGWYRWWSINETAGDFIYSAHFRWSSASKTPNPSGCGVMYAIQDDGSDYAVFLTPLEIRYLRSKFQHGYRVGKTRGTGKVNIGTQTEADFTLIVYHYYSYVIVNGEVVGEYSLPKSDIIEGGLGASILSGTNKGFGTNCSITNARLWTPNN